MKILSPQHYMRTGALRRSVLLADRGIALRRVIPVQILVALDEVHLAKDAHLTYGIQFDTGPCADREREVQLGFVARGCAYAAMLMRPNQQAYLYEHVMSLEDIIRYSKKPVSQFEIDRAELFDHIQGGNRAKLLGVEVSHIPKNVSHIPNNVSRFDFYPLYDRA